MPTKPPKNPKYELETPRNKAGKKRVYGQERLKILKQREQIAASILDAAYTLMKQPLKLPLIHNKTVVRYLALLTGYNARTLIRFRQGELLRRGFYIHMISIIKDHIWKQKQKMLELERVYNNLIFKLQECERMIQANEHLYNKTKYPPRTKDEKLHDENDRLKQMARLRIKK